MEIHVKIVGALMIVLSLMHIVIPKYFNWKQELAAVSLITRQVFYVHTFFIALVVLLAGLLCFSYSHDLIYTSLGRVITLGLFVFWFTRLIFQFFVYSSENWKGKKFETAVHIVFAITWFYFSVVFFLAYMEDYWFTASFPL